MTLIRNKKAIFDYEILQTFEAGLELFGHEVKSLRTGKGSLVGSHVLVRGDEAFLVNATIQPYQEGNTPKEYDPTRHRRLLLNKKELTELEKAEDTSGLTIVPISVYNKGRRLKLEIAIARGKKQHDKREVIKKRDTERDLRRSLKNR
jgi:SsrA-binding protein